MNPLEAFQHQAEPCVLRSLFLSTPTAMYKMTKEQLKAELWKFQEHPAPGWTKVEIRQRLLELQGRDQEPTQRELTSTTLQNVTREMRKASKTKAALNQYCTEELNLTLTGNETKPQLEMKAMSKILEITPGESMDVAGFGRHVDRRYHEFLNELRSYGEWVVQTARENPQSSDPRLRRLAAWLEPRMAMETLTENRPKGYPIRGTSSSGNPTPRIPKAAPKPLLKPKENDAAGSTTSSPEVVEDQAKKMTEMETMIRQLQDELASMRAERPRKQQAQADEESMTDRSFVNVTPRPQQ